MTRIFNRVSEKTKRKYLRNHMNSAEIGLWMELKGKKLGAKFRRQHSVGTFVLDFYCPKRKLAIEVDGISHHDHKTKLRDRERQKYVEQFGIEFLRFTDEQVTNRIDSVLREIRAALASRPKRQSIESTTP